MQNLHEPLIINLVVYKHRDDWLYRELLAVPPKYRSERLRNLAGLACLVPSLLALDGAASALSISSDALAHPDAEPTASAQDEASMPIKLTVNAFNYPELYRDLSAMPAGSISARIKVLAAGGAVLSRLVRLSDTTASRSPAQPPVQQPPVQEAPTPAAQAPAQQPPVQDAPTPPAQEAVQQPPAQAPVDTGGGEGQTREKRQSAISKVRL